MSTAVLISGQLRTFAQCWPTQRWHVLRHFPDCHFFITVQGNPEIVPDELWNLVQEYGSDRVHFQQLTDPDLSADLTPELSRAYHHAPYTNAAPAHQLLLQHWYQNECWKFFKSIVGPTRDKKIDDTFDTFIRLRADLWFHSFECPVGLTHEDDNGTFGSTVALTPWWGKFGGLNDRFAILGPEAARAYFTVYQHIPELLAAGCPFHPESLVHAALERSSIDHHPTLQTEFSTLRLNGQMRFPEISPADMAHCALRAA